MAVAFEHVTRVNGLTGRTPQVVLRDVTASFPEGQMIGILGARGCGKSTLIRLISGVLHPTRGHIRRRGTVSYPIGTVSSLHRNMSGRENIHFLARLYGVDARQAVDFVAAFSGLNGALDQPLSTYSGDKRARLGFTLSYALPFDVYLGDEAVVGGPPGFRDRCKQLARERLHGATLILATRSPALLRTFCSVAYVLDHGKLHPCDSIEDAVTRYADIIERIGSQDAEEASNGLDDLTDDLDAA